MAEYIENADDINVEGVEFYASLNNDGYAYEDAECTKKVSAEKLMHTFEMNDVVIVDDGVRHRAINMGVSDNIVTIQYFVINQGVVSGKELMSYDKRIDVDVIIDAGEDLFGKVISDLQSDIVINDDNITGSLKYVTDYTGFSSNPEEQNGNYLAIHCTNNYEDPISVEIIGGTHGSVQLDSDGIIVLFIRNNEQEIKVTSGDLVKTYSLTELELLSE